MVCIGIRPLFLLLTTSTLYYSLMWASLKFRCQPWPQLSQCNTRGTCEWLQANGKSAFNWISLLLWAPRTLIGLSGVWWSSHRTLQAIVEFRRKWQAWIKHIDKVNKWKRLIFNDKEVYSFILFISFFMQLLFTFYLKSMHIC